MYRMFMLALALLCSAAWLQAQDQSAQAPPSGSARPDSSHVAVEGCLQGSNGSFTITDSSGTTYQLQGDNAKLSKHVGHEVQITGSTSGSSAASSGSGMGGSQTLTVQKMKHISESCKTSK
jgi:Protein of unknown function (DUF5818)